MAPSFTPIKETELSLVQELLTHSPDVWITPVVVGYLFKNDLMEGPVTKEMDMDGQDNQD